MSSKVLANRLECTNTVTVCKMWAQTKGRLVRYSTSRKTHLVTTCRSLRVASAGQPNTYWPLSYSCRCQTYLLPHCFSHRNGHSSVVFPNTVRPYPRPRRNQRSGLKQIMTFFAKHKTLLLAC